MDKPIEEDTKIFGFWVYLMTDLIIFGVLFATFAVLRHNTFGGPTGRELFSMPYALAETSCLLTSSFTCSLVMLEVYKKRKKTAIFWIIITFALGASFLTLELLEFHRFVSVGASWRRSAFLSAFFALVGTHGCHIFVGLSWMLVSLFRIALRPLATFSISRIARMALFWHFLEFIWIFIFTIVYGMGHLIG